jgi:hypothetical protein
MPRAESCTPNNDEYPGVLMTSDANSTQRIRCTSPKKSDEQDSSLPESRQSQADERLSSVPNVVVWTIREALKAKLQRAMSDENRSRLRSWLTPVESLCSSRILTFIENEDGGLVPAVVMSPDGAPYLAKCLEQVCYGSKRRLAVMCNRTGVANSAIGAMLPP